MQTEAEELINPLYLEVTIIITVIVEMEPIQIIIQIKWEISKFLRCFFAFEDFNILSMKRLNYESTILGSILVILFRIEKFFKNYRKNVPSPTFFHVCR